MRVCLICVELFAWGKYGGFGRATRVIGRELALRGVEVVAVVPRRGNQRPVEYLDGFKVLSFNPASLNSAVELFREADADIYHSEEPSLSTYLAMRAMPSRRHIVTFRDTRDMKDWFTEFTLPSLNPLQVMANWLYEDNWLVHRAVRYADARFVAAKLLIPKARARYHLDSDPVFLPTPMATPAEVKKDLKPTVCFVSRWDRRKRPEIFFELAKEFPQVYFVAAGKSRDLAWDRHLRSTYGSIPNLEMVGFIDQFQSEELWRILGRSWILVNTSVREGLPNSFIEAAAHRCAILSSVDPDGFASQFGYHARRDDFPDGLETLLRNDLWLERAQLGYEYVRNTFSCDIAITQHLLAYNRVITTQLLQD